MNFLYLFISFFLSFFLFFFFFKPGGDEDEVIGPDLYYYVLLVVVTTFRKLKRHDFVAAKSTFALQTYLHMKYLIVHFTVTSSLLPPLKQKAVWQRQISFSAA